MTEDRLTLVFSALADPTRRDLVARLATGDATVGELAEPYDVSVQAISKHLKVLTQAGLVSRPSTSRRDPVHLEAEVFDLATGWLERRRREAEARYRRLEDVLAELDEDGNPLPADDARAVRSSSTHPTRTTFQEGQAS
ncbi:metalloregulator ArsR/SmtB family transcription factor [Arsenicicoccus piscis]|uniref:Transcriptional regulator n=1 Tax=Arsenicicoccus piscis TaxID=673954 RepID=A0ABQ6HSC3_9MICO|nr:metalloregulator ArsR/SmtB family transcription factor [Arsenicicoccus piscis]MCH8626633.1 metalloregulator ArsR/SmtB family transcription factor [Arsenicicoccus piscis]GMA21291.1 transcriptional regulator [Arsenicicoccus piscis]